ncbi:hypothetical protein BC826DRAFT_974308 [Russula brevipes]|nr:hypothetical protein BC826DRAFT_974308 [Russula brevipes]
MSTQEMLWGLMNGSRDSQGRLGRWAPYYTTRPRVSTAEIAETGLLAVGALLSRFQSQTADRVQQQLERPSGVTPPRCQLWLQCSIGLLNRFAVTVMARGGLGLVSACGSVAHTVGLVGLSAPSLFVTLPGRLSNRCGLASGSWPWLGRILLRGPVGPAPGFDRAWSCGLGVDRSACKCTLLAPLAFVNVGSAASGTRPAPQQAAAPEERGTSSPQVQAIDLRGPKEPEEDGAAKEEQEEVNVRHTMAIPVRRLCPPLGTNPNSVLGPRYAHVCDMSRAPNYPLRENVRLNSLKKVEDVLRVAKLRNEIATKIGVLEVYIKAGDRNGGDEGSFKSIRELIRLTVNITDLAVRFLPKPARVLPTSMIFESLTSLNVNTPHAIVAQFLQAHPHINDLTLGEYGTNSIPVTRLTTTYNDVGRLDYPVAQLLNFRPIITSSSLTVLHIDFDHTVTQLLLRLSVAAPALIILKLTESKFSSKFQMPWDDRDSWQAGLSSHPNLERFLLRTWGFLTPWSEVGLANQWLKFVPPKLYNLIVWSGSREGRGHLRIWDVLEMGRWRMREMSSTRPQDDPLDASFL